MRNNFNLSLQFKINGFKLSDISMAEAANYLKLLGDLFENNKDVRLENLVNGSVSAALNISSNAIDEALTCLGEANSPAQTKPRKAYQKIASAIQKNGGEGAEIIEFPTGKSLLRIDPKEKIKAQNISVKEDTLRGYISCIKENKTSYTGIIQHGEDWTRFYCDRDLAKLAGEKFLDVSVELRGTSFWSVEESGRWHLDKFNVENIIQIENLPLREIRKKIMESGFGFEGDIHSFLKEIRDDS